MPRPLSRTTTRKRRGKYSTSASMQAASEWSNALTSASLAIRAICSWAAGFNSFRCPVTLTSQCTTPVENCLRKPESSCSILEGENSGAPGSWRTERPFSRTRRITRRALPSNCRSRERTGIASATLCSSMDAAEETWKSVSCKSRAIRARSLERFSTRMFSSRSNCPRIPSEIKN
jgi:hypothetical protein